jgi:hypothetical protein
MAAEVDRPDIIAALAVRYAAIMTRQDDTPAPTPTPSGDCTTGCKCNGTGKERTGDGLSVVDCRCPDNCKCKASAPPKTRSEDPPMVDVPQANFQNGTVECRNGTCYYIDSRTGKRYRVSQ